MESFSSQSRVQHHRAHRRSRRPSALHPLPPPAARKPSPDPLLDCSCLALPWSMAPRYSRSKQMSIVWSWSYWHASRSLGYGEFFLPSWDRERCALLCPLNSRARLVRPEDLSFVLFLPLKTGKLLLRFHISWKCVKNMFKSMILIVDASWPMSSIIHIHLEPFVPRSTAPPGEAIGEI